MTRIIASLAIALASGCSGRLAVSDASIDAGGGGGTENDSGATPGNCQDGALSDEESDIDCGGPACPPCAALSSCSAHADCQSGSCRAGLCRESACDDGVKNGEETSVDCGGPSCRRCTSSTCNCATSPELTALECDETNGTIYAPGSDPLITPDGEVAVFMLCRSEIFVSGTPTCSTFRWTSAGSEPLANSGAYAMSRDGQRVLLQNEDASMSLLEVGGATTPVPLPFGAHLSGDGTQLVGIDIAESGARALLRWSEASGLELLAELSFESASNWQVTAVSSDASSVVGFVATETGDVPFRWTEANGLETLGPIPAGATGARPMALSEDGSVAVGITRLAAQNVEVFRWTSEGFQILAPAQTQYFPDHNYVQASPAFMATSTDGSVVAATIAYPNADSFSAYRFSTSEGTSILSTEAPGFLHDMTPDGSIFIGKAGQDSFKWIARPAVANEPRQFDAVRFSAALEGSGVDLTGWELLEPTSVSDDGRIVFGRAICAGVETLYRWVSPP